MLTEEKVKELIAAALTENAKENPGVGQDEINAAVNKAVTSQLKRASFKDTLKEVVTGAVAEATADLGKGDDDGDGDEGGKGKAKGDGELPPEVDKALKKLQKDNERLAKQLEEEKSERQKAADEARRSTERAKLTEALQASGIDKDSMPFAVAKLYTEDARVKTTDDGKIVWVDEEDDEVPLAEGVKKWAESDQGKRFVPPREASGSGSRSPVGTQGEDGKTTYTDADLGNALAGL